MLQALLSPEEYNDVVQTMITHRAHQLFKVDGVDYSSDGVESIRTALNPIRAEAMSQGEFSYAVIISHAIALLAWLNELAYGRDVETAMMHKFLNTALDDMA